MSNSFWALVVILGVPAAQPAPEQPAPKQAALRQLIVQPQVILGKVPVAQPVAPGMVEQDDETLLRGVDVPTDAPSLIGFLRRQKSDQNQERVRELVILLGDDDFEKRQAATDELIRLGPSALPALRKALKSADLEVVRRAEISIKAIDSVAGPAFQEAVVRLLAKKAPDQAVEVLLDVLPDLQGDTIIDTVAETMSLAGVIAGKPSSALVAALNDKHHLRREAAAEAIAKRGDANAFKLVEPLLKDTDVGVRVRLGLALLDRGQSIALPVLIRDLAEAPTDRAYEIESELLNVARENAPTLSLGKTAETRKKAVAAWEDWYKKAGEKLDLAKILQEANKPGGLVLSTMGNVVVAGALKNKVMEVDAAGKTAWELDVTGNAYSVQKLPRDRVLVAEYTGRKVYEKTTKGEVIWSKDIGTLPIEATRLVTGNTMIATRNSLIEVDGEGKEVRTITRTDLIYGMTVSRTGEIALMTSANKIVVLDREGKEVGGFQVTNRLSMLGTHIAMSPNGQRITVPIYGGGVVVGGAVVQQPSRVVEYDRSGNVIWEVAADRPTSVRRLANGNVLVASRYHSSLVEIDARGKVVNKYETPGNVRVIDASR